MISSRRKTLRKEMRTVRRALTPAQQQRASRQLFRRLAQHPLFIRSHHIAFYLANDGEIDPALLFNYARMLGKICYLPVISDWPRTRMAFQRIQPGQRWRRNRFGIVEPQTDRKVHARPWRLNLVLMPLVGFDEHGNRLGMGGGFYDRMFAYRRMRSSWTGPQLLGLAHTCQKVKALAVKSWDIPLDGIVTDTECTLFPTSGRTRVNLCRRRDAF